MTMATVGINLSLLGAERRFNLRGRPGHAGIDVHDIGFDRRDFHHYRPGMPHWNRDVLGLVWMVDGRGFFEAAAIPRRAMQPGDAAWCLPSLWSEYGPEPGAEWVECFCFAGGPVIEALAQPLSPRRQRIHLGHDQHLLRHMAGALDAAEADDIPTLSSHTYAIFARALAIAPEPAADQPRDPRLAEIVDGLITDPARAWDFHHLAATIGLSYDRFRSLFKRDYELAPQAFLHRQRMYLAEALLREGTSVADTCRRIGMHDPFHFSRRFKAFSGRSPRDVRGG